MEGLGYVEHMTLTIPPWQLPLHELRWGRFLNETNSLVWIDWKGDNPVTLVLHNGKEIQDVSVGNDSLRSAGGLCLSLKQHAIIRNGPLVSTTLSMIPGLSRIFPATILHTHERKWLSDGHLTLGDASVEKGWALHELVRFT